MIEPTSLDYQFCQGKILIPEINQSTKWDDYDCHFFPNFICKKMLFEKWLQDHSIKAQEVGPGEKFGEGDCW